VEELRVGTPETATIGSRTMGTSTVAVRTIYPYDASLDDAYARAKDQLDQAPGDDFAALRMIEDAIVVFARGQRRDLR
jgi:hypothetical protein